MKARLLVKLVAILIALSHFALSGRATAAGWSVFVNQERSAFGLRTESPSLPTDTSSSFRSGLKIESLLQRMQIIPCSATVRQKASLSLLLRHGTAGPWPWRGWGSGRTRACGVSKPSRASRKFLLGGVFVFTSQKCLGVNSDLALINKTKSSNALT